MGAYEPASGWNLPPGCTDSDIDRYFSEPSDEEYLSALYEKEGDGLESTSDGCCSCDFSDFARA